MQAYVAVSSKAPGENRVHQAVAHLHNARRNAEDDNLPDIGEAELHVPPANADGRILLDEELRNECRGHQLRTDGRPGGALDSPVEFHDKDVVENDVRDCTRNFTEHGGFGVPHRTDKVVHAWSDCLENRTAQQDAHIAARDWQGLLACPEQLEKRHHENLAQRERDDCHQD